jgi:two-component system, OmpR family, sensor kinase
VAIKNIRTAHLVHDLKNPANIIEMGARTLLERQDSYGELSPKQLKVVKRMLRSALKIKFLANCMLEVDMGSSGVTKVSDSTLSDILKAALVEVFDLVDPGISEAVEETATVETLRAVLSTHHVFLEGEEDQLTRPVRLDKTKLGLVLTNLLSNALKFRRQSIFLRCQADGDLINISVRDDGPGIPEPFHEKVFDQYFQCVPAEGFPVRGHGLGLAGAQALTEALGGRLYLCKAKYGAEFVVEVRFAHEK